MTAPAFIVTPLTPSAAGNEATGVPASSTTATVRVLTEAMANGDEDAFRAFHEAYFHRLLRYLFVVTRGDEEAAHDALQDTFARVARHIRAFDVEDVFWSWLTLLARTAAADGRRKMWRYWNLLSRFAVFRKTESQPNDCSDEARLERVLLDLTKTLPPLDRSLIEEKYLKGRGVRDLAHQFQLSERAIESRLARARRQLRDELVKCLKDENTD